MLLAAFQALFRGRLLLFSARMAVGAAMLAAGAAVWALAFGIQGYRALTREEVAARISITPLAPQRFEARVTLADGGQERFELAGDEVYVDAQILKWKPFANLLGLHTAYELDRIAGRYRDIARERDGVRTVHSLGSSKAFDLFELRSRYAFLAPLVDAEYGSATFVPAAQPKEIEIRVSASGPHGYGTSPPTPDLDRVARFDAAVHQSSQTESLHALPGSHLSFAWRQRPGKGVPGRRADWGGPAER
ncbi:MAG: hypothetical protein MZW92_78690 [Comamonadaceae bacterium]|nr:hypothetical protein [Comamonadaceae bacterium]